MSDLAELVASRVRARRTALSLTQAELAERAGVSTELVSRIERARCLPSLPTLIGFARALSSTPNDLTGFEPQRPSRDLQDLIAVLSTLPAARRRDLRRIAEALAHYEKDA